MENKAIIRNYAFSNFDDVKTIVFLDNVRDTGNEVTDYSLNDDMSVVGWYDQTDTNILYVAPAIGNKIYIKGTAEYLFYNCQCLEEIKGIEVLDTSESTDMYCMFSGCDSLASLNISSFNTRNVTSMRSMFDGCEKLINLNITNFDTFNVIDMACMFKNCHNLVNLDVSNFNTSKVTDMSCMFENCQSLVNLDVSNFDTSKVKYMEQMFENCQSLVNLDVSNFDTSNVTDMTRMFAYCCALQKLDISKFDFSNVEYGDFIFVGSDKLMYIKYNNIIYKDIQDMINKINDEVYGLWTFE